MTDVELDEMLRLFKLRNTADALRFVDSFTGRRHRLRHFLAWGVRARLTHPTVCELISHINTDLLLTPEELGEIRSPTMLIWGPEDEVLPAKHQNFFRSHLSQGTRILAPPGYGHVPYLDRLGDFTGQIKAFLESLALIPDR